MQEQHEKREFSRIQLPVKVHMRCGTRAPITAVSFDLSLNGVSFSCAERVDIGAACDVLMRVGEADNGLEIEAAGKVVRADGEVVAIAFDGVEFEGFEHLKNLLAYNAEDTSRIDAEFDSHIGLNRK